MFRLNFICGSTRLKPHEIPIKFRKGRARSGGALEFVEDELKSSVLHKGTVDGGNACTNRSLQRPKASNGPKAPTAHKFQRCTASNSAQPPTVHSF